MRKRKFERGDRVVWGGPGEPEIFGTVISGVETATKNRYKVRWETTPRIVTRWEISQDMIPAHPLLRLAEEAPS